MTYIYHLVAEAAQALGRDAAAAAIIDGDPTPFVDPDDSYTPMNLADDLGLDRDDDRQMEDLPDFCNVWQQAVSDETARRSSTL